MKKIFVLAFSLLLSLSVIGCADKKETSVNVKNSIVQVNTIEEAEKISGFDIKLPENFFDENFQREIRVIKDKFIEVDYKGLEQWIIIRKALYDGEEDISGDYNQYPEEREENYGDVRVSFRGNEGKINVVSWKVGKYTYSININPGGIGIKEDVLYEIMWQID